MTGTVFTLGVMWFKVLGHKGLRLIEGRHTSKYPAPDAVARMRLCVGQIRAILFTGHTRGSIEVSLATLLGIPSDF